MGNKIYKPVYASDYLDLSGYKGHGSVAGIIDSENQILVGYKANLTYKEAKAVAKIFNGTNLSLKRVLKYVKGTANGLKI